MSRPTQRKIWVSLAVVAVFAFAGGLLGGRVEAEPDRGDLRLRDFGRILALVEDNYVGNADSEELVESAIQGMLRRLDPHSNFLDKDAFTEMRDEQRGKFSGLGIQITKRGPDKPLTIIAPIDGTPAARAGLQAGDVIFKIEGEATMELTVQQAVRKLKGERGTKVTITIQRPGDEEAFDVTLVRDDIPTKSIPVAFMLDAKTGLVRISNFTTTTVKELDQSLASLRDRGMTRLILDLRGNPGGLLEQAVQVSERFLPAGKMVVYTRGRIAGADQDYLAQRGVDRVAFPLVVLVDHSSASASEIVSGAIQDHDRGVLVGVTTFGKGLVQRVIPLTDGTSAVAVTTAKYYTPSGRLIQRDYTDLDDYFFDDPEGGEAPPDDPSHPREIRHTDAGRTVYGGGGITPDHIVKAERASAFFSRLNRENAIFDFVVRYLTAHPEAGPALKVDDAMIAEFRKFIESRKVEFTDEELTADRNLVSLRIRAQIARVKIDAEAESRVLAEGDPQIQMALTLFDEAAALQRTGEAARDAAQHATETAGSDI